MPKEQMMIRAASRRVFDAMAQNDEFIAFFHLVDAAHLAATCRGLRGIHLPLIVRDRSLVDC